MKDWTGNRKSTFVTLGASNHSDHDREKDDFYSTDPHALEIFLKEFNLHKKIWEPACGMGHLSEVLLKNGYEVLSTDLVNRGYGLPEVNFFKAKR